jgi:hypothetical protein
MPERAKSMLDLTAQRIFSRVPKESSGIYMFSVLAS